MRGLTLVPILLSVSVWSGCQSATSPSSSGVAPGADCSAIPEKILKVAEIRQKGTNWCWAASGEMVMGYFNAPVRQCEQVKAFLGLPQCCGLIVERECDKTGWPEFERYNFHFQRTSSKALTWQQIKEEVACKGNPIAFSWKFPGGSGHMMVIKGVRTEDGKNYVLVNDPAKRPEYAVILYETYVRGDLHWDDFYDFKR